jgi:hypothetical protein
MINQKAYFIYANFREYLPWADVAYQFKSKAGRVKVQITTAGENYTVSINAVLTP